MEGDGLEGPARALCACEQIDPDKLVYVGAGAYWPAWRTVVPSVRAVIRAVHEPTEAQYDALCATDKVWREQTSETVWKIYIDALLAE